MYATHSPSRGTESDETLSGSSQVMLTDCGATQDIRMSVVRAYNELNKAGVWTSQSCLGWQVTNNFSGAHQSRGTRECLLSRAIVRLSRRKDGKWCRLAADMRLSSTELITAALRRCHDTRHANPSEQWVARCSYGGAADLRLPVRVYRSSPPHASSLYRRVPYARCQYDMSTSLPDHISVWLPQTYFVPGIVSSRST